MLCNRQRVLFLFHSYTCDEFVINDTAAGHLEKLRKSLNSFSCLAQKSQRLVLRCSVVEVSPADPALGLAFC